MNIFLNLIIKDKLLSIMGSWNSIFNEKGKVFIEPHPDMEGVAAILHENKFKKILDLGFGTGRHLIYLAKKGFELYGLDAAPKGLEIAKEWLKNEGVCAKLFIHRMEKKFPFKDEYFDAIISIQVIHHNFIKNILFTVKEIKRVLKKGGYIFITFPILNAGTKIDEWELKEVEQGTYIPLAGPEKGLPHHFFTIGEIYEVFGFLNLLKVYIDQTNHRAILGVKK